MIILISIIFLCVCFCFYTEEMAPISDEIEVKDEPWINSSKYDQVSYGFQVSRILFHSCFMNLQNCKQLFLVIFLFFFIYIIFLSLFYFSYLIACMYVCIYISASHFFSSTMIKMATSLQREGR